MAQTSNAHVAIPSHQNGDHITLDANNAISGHSRRSFVISANAVLRSIISGPVDSIDEEEDNENASNASNNGRRRRRISPMYICVPVTLLILFLIFAGTLAGAIVSWHQYEVRHYHYSCNAHSLDSLTVTQHTISQKLRLRDSWFVRSCIIVNARVTKSSQDDKWRPEADVRGFGLKNESEIVTAYWGRNKGYYYIEERARRLIKQLPSVGKRVTCWVKHKDTRAVSMVKVNRTAFSQEDVYLNMAWGSSFFAAVSGFLLLTVAVNFVQRALVYAVNGGERATAENDQAEGNNATKRTACLSPAQTRWVASQFGDVVEGKMMPDEWACSICLEECEETQRLRVIVLPCNHRFHSRCLKRWLRRGSPTCPLCNFDVHSLFNEDGTPIDSHGHAVVSPTATEGQIEAVVLDMRPNTNDLANDGEQGSVLAPNPLCPATHTQPEVD